MKYFDRFQFIEFFFLLIIALYLINFILIKYSALIDNTNYSNHKKFTNNFSVTPLSGGIFLFMNLVLFNLQQEFTFILFLFLIGTIGILSDLNKVNSPYKRLFLQTIVVIAYIFLDNVNIQGIRIEIIDKYLDFKILNIIFTAFCILILLNGSNFIDGLNNLQVGYYLVVLFFVLELSISQNLIINLNYLHFLLIVYLVFYLFNFFGKCFLGDSGSYIVTLTISDLLIEFSNYNSTISPYYIVVLLWYPAFENFFSILRKKFLTKQNALLPDNYHLHHIIYNIIKKNKKHRFYNTLTGNLIVVYNILPFYLASKFFYSTKILTSIVLVNVILYLIIFFKFKNSKTK